MNITITEAQNRVLKPIMIKIGNIISLQNSEIPTDSKFSLGGRWLRGFDSFGVGPRNSRSSYIGGNNIIVTKFDIQNFGFFHLR